METELNKSKIESEYAAVYTPLVKKFCDKVCKSIDLKNYKPIPRVNENGEQIPGKNRAPAPFLPIIGDGYYDASIKVAFYGMETYCWHDLYRFVTKFDKDNTQSLADVKAYTDGDDKKYTNRFHNHHGLDYENDSVFGFWKFVYSTLAGIYNKDESVIRKDESILKSFIWGNVNAYEKYNATWKDLKVDNKITDKKKDWKCVFKAASKYFNSAQLLLPYTHPQIMVVFYWGMTRMWLTNKEGKWQDEEKKEIVWSEFNSRHPELSDEQKNILKHYIRCYYVSYGSDSGTYVIRTMHPQGMLRRGKGMSPEMWKAAIKHVLQQIMQNDNFPSSH